MAINVYPGAVDRIACAAVAGNMTRLDLIGVATLLLRPIAANAKITHTGADAAAIGADYATLDHSAWTPWPVQGLAYVLIAHTDNNGVVEVWGVQETPCP